MVVFFYFDLGPTTAIFSYFNVMPGKLNW